DLQDLHSFPTRRSSDLQVLAGREAAEDPDHLRASGELGRGLVNDDLLAGRFCWNEFAEAPLVQDEGSARHIDLAGARGRPGGRRSEEHTSELQSRENLV